MIDKVRHDVAVFIGRMRPLHNGHLAVLRAAYAAAKHVIVVIGSEGQRRDDYNLFTTEEVAEMLDRSLTTDEYDRTRYLSMHDFGDGVRWAATVERGVHRILADIDREQGHFRNGLPPKIALIGHSKDNSSYYLKMFPNWDSIEVGNHEQINATDIRLSLLDYDDPHEAINDYSEFMPEGTVSFLNEWVDKPYLETVKDERAFMRHYLEGFNCESNRRYNISPKFYTGDSVVLCAGDVLLVKRGAYPAKGAWALPGGHVNDDETAKQASFRELIEETGIDVSKRVLRQSFRASKLFDAPYRSTRRRTISVSHLYVVEPEIKVVGGKTVVKRPNVKGMDDAEKAQWFPVQTVLETMREEIMEDHAQQIEWALAVLEGNA